MTAIWYLVDFPKLWEEGEIQEFTRICSTGEIVRSVFFPSCERMKRYQGAWHREKRYLFPRSILLETADKKALERFLGKLSLMGFDAGQQEEGCVAAPAKESTVNFLQRLCGTGQHIGFSRGYIRQGRTFVTEGPLMGKESCIQRIDRHKRLARLAIDMPGRDAVDLGMDIYGKD